MVAAIFTVHHESVPFLSLKCTLNLKRKLENLCMMLQFWCTHSLLIVPKTKIYRLLDINWTFIFYFSLKHFCQHIFNDLHSRWKQECIKSSCKVKATSYTYTVLNRPLGLQVTAPIISRKLAHVDSKVDSPTHWPLLPPRRYPWYLFLLEAELTPGQLCGQKG